MQAFNPAIDSFLKSFFKNKDYSVLPLAGDASNRRYYRLIMDQQSWVLMCWDPFDEKNYPFLSVLNHFHENQVNVPQVFDMSPKEGVIILEDLGDLTLERKFWESQSQDFAFIFYQMAIDELIKIHYQATDKFNPNCTAFKIKFDTEKFLWEMNYGKDNLITGVLKFALSPKAETELQRIFTDICKKLDQEPKRISHRDYHSRNLMIKLNKMGVIDFQDARLGPIQYDLVSLLKDSYVDMGDELASRLISDYLTKAAAHLPKDFSKEHFDWIYELQSIQRCFKACGSFASFFHQRQDRRYLKYLNPTLKRVLKALNSFPDYKAFSDILLDSGALEKNYESL